MKKFLSLLLFLPLFVQAQVIVTVAGTGVYGYSGEGGPATDALLAHPEGVALDPSGNLYICDNSCIRKVSPAIVGIITTFAGVGTSGGYSGDGGYANAARVNGAHYVAVDKYGNVYLADGGNNRIRKVTVADGIINTIAGTGFPGYNGDSIPATTAHLNGPLAIAVDDTGNVYFTDNENRRVRKIDTAGIITTIAGTGVNGFSGDGGKADTAQLHRPHAITFNKEGILYFSDSTRIRRIDASGVITTVAGVATFGFSGDGGPATDAEIVPAAITFDTSDNLIIAESSNHRLRKVNKDGIITTIAGTGYAAYNGEGIHPLVANIYLPSGIAVSSTGDIFIGDQGNNRVRMITTSIVDKVDQVTMPKGHIEVSPNPCRGNCTLNIAYPTNEKATVVITDMAGTRIMDFEASTNESVALSAAHLPCGVYVVTAIIGQSRLTGKLVVE